MLAYQPGGPVYLDWELFEFSTVYNADKPLLGGRNLSDQNEGN
jgi:hypothetical protein